MRRKKKVKTKKKKATAKKKKATKRKPAKRQARKCPRKAPIFERKKIPRAGPYLGEPPHIDTLSGTIEPPTDSQVRPHIEAAKQQLTAEGFTDVEDPPEIQRAFEEHLHVIQMMAEGTRKFLRLSYDWLADQTPEEVRRWLDYNAIAMSLKEGGHTEVSIFQAGTMEWR